MNAVDFYNFLKDNFVPEYAEAWADGINDYKSKGACNFRNENQANLARVAGSINTREFAKNNELNWTKLYQLMRQDTLNGNFERDEAPDGFVWLKDLPRPITL